jgi:hypothetical protein
LRDGDAGCGARRLFGGCIARRRLKGHCEDPEGQKRNKCATKDATGGGFPHCWLGIGVLGGGRIPEAGEASRTDRTAWVVSRETLVMDISSSTRVRERRAAQRCPGRPATM